MLEQSLVKGLATQNILNGDQVDRTQCITFNMSMCITFNTTIVNICFNYIMDKMRQTIFKRTKGNRYLHCFNIDNLQRGHNLKHEHYHMQHCTTAKLPRLQWLAEATITSKGQRKNEPMNNEIFVPS